MTYGSVLSVWEGEGGAVGKSRPLQRQDNQTRKEKPAEKQGDKLERHNKKERVAWHVFSAAARDATLHVPDEAGTAMVVGARRRGPGSVIGVHSHTPPPLPIVAALAEDDNDDHDEDGHTDTNTDVDDGVQSRV